jgi:hypothetical protein
VLAAVIRRTEGRDVEPSVARRLWLRFEPYHASVYFAPEAAGEYAAIGLTDGRMGYFASRSAAVGAVGPGVVTALFFNFAPALVRRALPEAWTHATPQRVGQARLAVADAALRRLLGDDVGSDAVRQAADLAMAAVAGAGEAGRPLFAAHADLEVPHDAHLRLWHAVTCLREHRGDGHIATLVAGNLDGCEANVVAVATGLAPAEQRTRRGWTEQEWAAAQQRLAHRGLLGADGRLTPGGTLARDAIEAQTDALALQPYTALGEDGCARLLAALEPIARRLDTAGVMPYPNPVGLPRAF